ncbi:Ig-like domain-containing protein [Sphaerotilus mobilis]|nr:Ig-like domain-containing protein [Sphaerotilus mobilis]
MDSQGIDTKAPTITQFTSSTDNGSYNEGDTITIQATASENLQAGATITVTLNTVPATTVTLTRHASTANLLEGSYPVAAGQNADDLTVVSYTLGTASAAPKDVAGNAMISTAQPADSSNIGGLKNLVIDTTAPTLVISDTQVSGTATGDVTYTFQFSETVTGFDASDVTVTNGSKGLFTAVDGDTYTLVVSPTANAQGADIGVSVGTGLSDVAGNAIASTTTAAAQAWDRKLPTITQFTSTKADGAYKVGEAFVIQATASENLQAGATITVTLNTVPATTVTLTRHASTANLLEGTYTVAAGQNAADLTVASYTLGTSSAAPKDDVGNLMTSTTVPAASSNIGGLKNLVIDTQAPTLAISDSQVSGTATGDVTYTFQFSETVTGFGAADVTVTNGTKGMFTAVDGDTYTLVVSPTADAQGADIGVSVGTGLNDLAGNFIASTTTAAVQAWDRKLPTITQFTSTKADGAYKVGEAIVIQATASENLQAGATITVTLNTVPATTVLLTRHASTANLLEGTYTVAAGQNAADLTVASYTLGTASAAPKDDAGNLMTSTTVPAAGSNIGGLKNLVIDTQAPTLAISDSQVSGTATGDVTYTFQFSETVTGFTADDVNLTNGSKGTFTAVDGDTYTLVVSPAVDTEGADIGVSVGTGLSDVAGNAIASTTTAAVQAWDRKLPTITQFTSSTVNGSYNEGDTITIQATASENLQAGATITVTLNTVPATTVLLTRHASTANLLEGTYTVAAGQNAADLTVASYTLGTASAAPKDDVGNLMTSTTVPAASSNIGGLKDVVIDTQAPTLAISDSLASGTATGDVTYTFQFSETVTGFDASDVTVTTGSKGTFTAVDGDTYTLVVSPAVNTEGADIGVSVGTGLTDVAGNAIAAITTADAQAWDRKAPTITRFTSSKTDGAYKAGEAIVIQATASENLQDGATITVTLNSGGTALLTRVTGSANLLEGTYTVSAGQNVADLSVASYTLGTSAAAPKDIAGNLMTSTALPTGSNLGDLKNLEIDTVAPTGPSVVLTRATDNLPTNEWTVAATQATRIASATGQGSNNRITVAATLTGDMTAEGWFKADAPTASATQHLFYVVGPSGPYELFIRNGELLTWSTGAGDQRVDLNGSAAGTGSFTSTDWNHFAVTTNGSGGWVVYLNGTQVHSQSAISMSSTATSVTVYAGNHKDATTTSSGSNNSFNGLVSSIELWDTQRTAAQITQDMLTVSSSDANRKGAWLLGSSNSTNEVSGGSAATLGSATSLAAINRTFVSNDGTQTLSGTLSDVLPENHKVVVLSGDTVVGEASPTGTIWTITTSALSQGVQSLTAAVSDRAGNLGPRSAVYSVNINSVVSRVDLDDSTADTQSRFAQLSNEAADIAIAPKMALTADDDISSIEVSIGGTINTDVLKLGAISLTLNGSAQSASNVTVAGVSGVNWSYSGASSVVTLSRNGGGAFTATQVQQLEKALTFTTAELDPSSPVTFGFKRYDLIGNASETATVDLDVVTIMYLDLLADTAEADSGRIGGTASDGITAAGVLKVSGGGTQWQYTLNGGATWESVSKAEGLKASSAWDGVKVDANAARIYLPEGSYTVANIQVRKSEGRDVANIGNMAASTTTLLVDWFTKTKTMTEILVDGRTGGSDGAGDSILVNGSSAREVLTLNHLGLVQGLQAAAARPEDVTLTFSNETNVTVYLSGSALSSGGVVSLADVNSGLVTLAYNQDAASLISGGAFARVDFTVSEAATWNGSASFTNTLNFKFSDNRVVIYGDASGNGAQSGVNDITVYSNTRFDGVVAQAGQAAPDKLMGGSANDVIFGDGSGGSGANSPTTNRNISGGAAGGASDHIFGGAGSDLIFGDGFNGANGENVSPFSDGTNVIGIVGEFGGGGSNNVYGRWSSSNSISTSVGSTTGGGGAGGLADGAGGTALLGNTAGGSASTYVVSGFNFRIGGFGAGVQKDGLNTNAVIVEDTLSSVGSWQFNTPASGQNSAANVGSVYSQMDSKLLNSGTTFTGLTSGVGDDVIHGGRGHDKIAGGNGSDRIVGGQGNDLMWGNGGGSNGANNDTFVWQRGDAGSTGAADEIRDWNASSMKLDISGLLENHAALSITGLANWVTVSAATAGEINTSMGLGSTLGGGGVKLVIDVDGVGGSSVTQTIYLRGITYNAATMDLATKWTGSNWLIV